MHRLASAGALVAAALTLISCESAGGKVSVLQSPSYAIQAGETYAWMPPSRATTGDARIDNDIIRERIRTAIDISLAQHGLHRVEDASSAQILVSYHVGLQTRTDYRVDAPPGGVACGWRGCINYSWGMYGAPTDVRAVNYSEGTLMLDLTDRASGQLAWRATSQKRVDEQDATQDRINAILADMTKSLAAPAAR
ncbi:MAG: DUF4136 domain-containing protein [Pseudomonadota bacterium]